MLFIPVSYSNALIVSVISATATNVGWGFIIIIII